MRTFKRIAVYCGASGNVHPEFKQAAEAMGTCLAKRGIGVVYGGGRVGLMGEVANAALAADGEVYGVIPHKLQSLELGHRGCTELFTVDSMHARKAMMANLADGFVALPGGFGTWEELLEVATLTLLDYQAKPIGILNVRGYYDPFLEMIAHAVSEGFIRRGDEQLILSAETPEALLEKMAVADLPTLRSTPRKAAP